MELGALPPDMRTPLPGPMSRALVDLLVRTEIPSFTARRLRRELESGAGQDPIVWREARGANVVDADGNRYVDFTSGFGVALVGHSHPSVVSAIGAQSTRLLHALGDLHPSDVKLRLLERLAILAPFDHARIALALSGSEAIEIALKTAVLSTGRPGILAFEGSYHGLAYGPLAACGYHPKFRDPFLRQLNPLVRFAPWGKIPELDESIGAVLVEPIQGRGGTRLPPAGFLPELGERAAGNGSLVIVDEIFTGLGRCGRLFAHDEELVADVICLGKGLGGGLPVSACIGPEFVMNAWASDDQEAIHTGTFFGNPLSAASALATLDVLEGERLIGRSAELGPLFATALRDKGFEVRGAGLMLGVVMDGSVLPLVGRLLERGYLTLPAGRDADVLQLVPPLNIAAELLDGFVDTLAELV